MREYDLESYRRKWQGTIGFYRTTPDGPLHQGLLTEFYEAGERVVGVRISARPGSETVYVVEDQFEGLPQVQLVYHPVKSGWYHHPAANALVIRSHTKSYQVGISENTHVISFFGPDGHPPAKKLKTHVIDFFTRPKTVPFYPEVSFGILSDTLWWKKDKLYYLNELIGTFTPKKVMLNNPAYLPYVQPYIGDVCQITY